MNSNLFTPNKILNNGNNEISVSYTHEGTFDGNYKKQTKKEVKNFIDYEKTQKIDYDQIKCDKCRKTQRTELKDFYKFQLDLLVNHIIKILFDNIRISPPPIGKVSLGCPLPQMEGNNRKKNLSRNKY